MARGENARWLNYVMKKFILNICRFILRRWWIIESVEKFYNSKIRR